MNEVEVRKIEPYLWEIPKTGEMRVPGRIFASEDLMAAIRTDHSLEQVRNVASLPGIVGWSLAMPDIHWGYGFPIGGVAATNAKSGAISPGGVGYDINCGVRLARSDMVIDDLDDKVRRSLIDRLYQVVPSGVGASGAIRKLSRSDLERVLVTGARWAIEHGYGHTRDLEYTEAGGRLGGADPDCVSDRAKKRGLGQVGTLGSGNHFLEVQRVARLFDTTLADAFGLFPDQIVVMIHSGSRGL
ncbi:MAG: RtcB family protein, partial [Gemmatimonadota bacterium]